MEPPTYLNYLHFYFRPLLHILTTGWRVLWIVLTQHRSKIRNFQSTYQGKVTVVVESIKAKLSDGVGVCSMAAKSDTPKHAFKLHDFITRAYRKRSKPQSKFPMIEAGASVFCQRPIRRVFQYSDKFMHSIALYYIHITEWIRITRSLYANEAHNILITCFCTHVVLLNILDFTATTARPVADKHSRQYLHAGMQASDENNIISLRLVIFNKRPQ